MKRATITGADGFVGQWLVQALLARGDEVTGLIRAAMPALTTLSHEAASGVRWQRFDLGDAAGLKRIIDAAKPDEVFHLAAQSAVPESLSAPAQTIETNLLGTLNVLEACRAGAPDARLLFVGSADAYGPKPPEAMPLREETPLEPRNPYAASKAAAEVMVRQYASSGWCDAVVTRSFNHAGPGQSPKFAIAAFAKQVADVKHHRQTPPIRVGALQPERDFTDVRDVVRAYVLLLERGASGAVYNVCSGKAYSMQRVLDDLMALAGIAVEVVVDQSLLRPVETPRLLGEASRLQRDTGWQPEIGFERTLRDMLAYYG